MVDRVLIQILCSYVTLPLYALVTQVLNHPHFFNYLKIIKSNVDDYMINQMGSNMKPTIFNERVVEALKNWHHTARKHVKQNKAGGSVTSMSISSRPTTPSRNTSPVHLLRYHRSDVESYRTSLRRSVEWDIEDQGDGSSSHRFVGERRHSVDINDNEIVNESGVVAEELNIGGQHEIELEVGNTREFSFDKRASK